MPKLVAFTVRAWYSPIEDNASPLFNIIEMIDCPTGNRSNRYAVRLKSCRETDRSPGYCPWY